MPRTQNSFNTTGTASILAAAAISATVWATDLSKVAEFERRCAGHFRYFPLPTNLPTAEQLIPKGALSVDAALSDFPEEWKKHPTLFFASRCDQVASFREPRILLNLPGMLATVASSKSGKGQDQIFFLRFDDKTSRYQIGIANYAVSPPKIESPPNCLRCHGNPPQPRWESKYAIPGVYEASENDSLLNVGNYLELVKPVPSRMKAFTVDSHAFPSDVGRAIAPLHYREIVAQLDSHSYGAASRYAIAAAFVGCEDFPSFFPAKIQQEHELRLGQNRAALRKDTAAVIGTDAALRLRTRKVQSIEFAQVSGRNFDDKALFSKDDIEIDRVTDFRYLFEGAGEPIDRWFLGHREQGHRSYNLIIGGGDLEGVKGAACLWIPRTIAADSQLAFLADALRLDDNVVVAS